MDDGKWIAEEAALDWMRQQYDLSGGAAKATLKSAVDSGNIVLRDFLVAELGDGRMEYMPARISSLKPSHFVHDLRMDFEDLRWQIRKQLGEAPRARATESADRQQLAAAAELPSGIRTNQAASAERECKELIQRWTATGSRPANKEAAFLAAQKEVGIIGHLSRKAFERAWARAAPEDWKIPGAPSKNRRGRI
jgi:hypothetical protein